MLLSIVIPTCNRYPSLQLCLRQLAPEVQGPDAGEYEIIVTDDAPDDALRAKLATDFPAVRWTQGPRRGPAANRNHGARTATGDWLVFLDDDCLPSPKLLATYRRLITDGSGREVIEGAIFPDRPQQRMDEEAPINDTGGCLWSCNFAIRRQLFLRLGGFCEAFPYAALEDVELRERLRQANITFDFLPEASVTHAWRPMALTLRFLKIQIESHRILFGLHPGFRSNPLQVVRKLVGTLYRQGYREGRPLGFRGFGRWLVRLAGVIGADFYLTVAPPLRRDVPKSGA